MEPQQTVVFQADGGGHQQAQGEGGPRHGEHSQARQHKEPGVALVVHKGHLVSGGEQGGPQEEVAPAGRRRRAPAPARSGGRSRPPAGGSSPSAGCGRRPGSAGRGSGRQRPHRAGGPGGWHRPRGSPSSGRRRPWGWRCPPGPPAPPAGCGCQSCSCSREILAVGVVAVLVVGLRAGGRVAGYIAVLGPDHEHVAAALGSRCPRLASPSALGEDDGAGDLHPGAVLQGRAVQVGGQQGARLVVDLVAEIGVFGGQPLLKAAELLLLQVGQGPRSTAPAAELSSCSTWFRSAYMSSRAVLLL